MSSEGNSGFRRFLPGLDWTALIADRKIKDAMDAGEFDDLKGKGEPLHIENDPFTPPEVRAAHRLLKNANALPQWLQMEKDIEREKAAFTPYVERGVRAVTSGKNAASREHIARRFRAEVRERVDVVNTLILKYNELAPASVQRVFAPYSLKRELESLDSRLAGILGTDGTRRQGEEQVAR